MPASHLRRCAGNGRIFFPSPLPRLAYLPSVRVGVMHLVRCVRERNERLQGGGGREGEREASRRFRASFQLRHLSASASPPFGGEKTVSIGARTASETRSYLLPFLSPLSTIFVDVAGRETCPIRQPISLDHSVSANQRWTSAERFRSRGTVDESADEQDGESWGAVCGTAANEINWRNPLTAAVSSDPGTCIESRG